MLIFECGICDIYLSGLPNVRTRIKLDKAYLFTLYNNAYAVVRMPELLKKRLP